VPVAQACRGERWTGGGGGEGVTGREFDGTVTARRPNLPGKVQEVGGKGKEAAGDATGNEDLKTEGQADQATGNVKQAGEKIQDVFK